jgi:hypothetical protein
MTSKSADLTDEEINHICAPLTQNAAKVRHLVSLKLIVAQAPDGRPLVNRAHYDAVRGGSDRKNAANGPKWRKSA